MYNNLFHKMGFTQKDLKPVRTPLIGFNSSSILPLEKITLMVHVGIVAVLVEFVVIDSDCLYNAIMGKTWLHMLREAHSFYHQKIKFPTPRGIIEICGDQPSLKSYFYASIKTRGK
ncbi:unnamed protein product [Ilex paraguariensis]|uniref:Uncharacterized protein n=1 Tax=Ilex paraguariensis TaxID=185542 RepID=A0ABC8TM18_9AQUA